MPMLTNSLINGTLLQDPGEGMLVDLISVGAGIAGDARILEDEDYRILEDDDYRILEDE